MLTKCTILSLSVLCLVIIVLVDKKFRDCGHLLMHQTRSASTRQANISSFNIKKPGEVYDCLSGQTIRKYDPLIKKRSAPIRIPDQPGEDATARKSSFIEIFDKQVWGGKEAGVVNKMSVNYKASGQASVLHMAMGSVALLHTIIEKLKLHLNKNVISIADIPCGDLQWMSDFLKTRSDIKYTGIDIVPSLIERHKKTYYRHPNINFLNADVVHSPLNQSFDVIFSRKMMQHFKNSDIIRNLKLFSESGSKFMIATTHSNLPQNIELRSTIGFRFRPLDLEKPPFNLVPPICLYKEPSQIGNYLGLWELPLTTITA